MEVQCFPFRVKNIDELDLPILIYENSRYKIELAEIDQEIIDKVFPEKNIVKIKGGYKSTLDFNRFRLAEVYRDLIEGDVILRFLRKTNSSPENYRKIENAFVGINSVLQIVTGHVVYDYISFDEFGNRIGGGSKGSSRPYIPIKHKSDLTIEQIDQMKEYIQKYIQINDNRLLPIFELLRMSDINGANSYGLKCSLQVLILETFFLNGIPSKKEIFAECLDSYCDNNQYEWYERIYANRGVFFHSGQDSFIAEDWGMLSKISKKLICDYLDGPKSFKLRIHKITQKYRSDKNN